MPTRCADCGHQMLLSPDGATQSVSCEACGGTRLERDQPSPTHSDGDLRNMVDPGIGLDQGGNPNMEGIFATGEGWQPFHRRDESYASVKVAMDGFDFESEPNLPSHHVIVDPYGGVYSGSYPETHESIADRHRLEDHTGVSKGAVFPDGSTEWYTHASGHSPQAIEQMLHGHFGRPVNVDPGLKGQSEDERWGLTPGPARGELDTLYGPPRTRSRGMPLDRNEGLVRGGGYERTSNMDPYLPWTHEAEVKEAEVPAEVPAAQPQAPAYTQEAVQPGPYGIHAGTTKWLKFLDAHVNGVPVRESAEHIIATHGNPNHPIFGQPVTVSAHHPDHLRAAIDTIEQSASGGQPSPVMIEVGRAVQRGQLQPPPGIDESSFKRREASMMYKAYGIHMSFLPLLGLGAAALGGEAAGAGLLGAAAPALMRGALMGTGSHMVQGLLGGGQDAAGQGASMPPEPRDLNALSRVADLETPHTTPFLHDNPDGDNHQFKDQSTSPNPNNPNLNGEAGGSQLGEDNVPGGFGPNSPSMERFNLLFPAIMHYYHSDQSGAQDPMIRELHDMMDKEKPGYLDSVDDEQGNQAVQGLIQRLRDPGGVHAKIGAGWNSVYPTRDVADPNQVNWAQGGQPQQGQCAYCGGTTNPDGSCPQCGMQNNTPGMPPQALNSAPAGGFRPNPATPFVGKTAADTQGPVSPEQIAAVQQLLLDTNRAQEVPNVPIHPENYAEELAQVTQQNQTTPPPVDPSQQPPPPPVDPSQMGQMPMPGMSIPGGGGAGGPAVPFTGKVATPHAGAPRCPKCGSATTGFINGLDGQAKGDCHSCGNTWNIDGEVIKTSADPNPAAAPAADQTRAYDPSQDQDSSHTWQDVDSEPLVPGQEYEMFTPGMSIPDRVRIDQVKPDELLYSTVGELNPDPSNPGAEPLTYQSRISREDFQVRGYQFHKADNTSDAGDQSLQQYQDTSQAPVNTEPSAVQSSVEGPDDSYCPKCASAHISHSMSSPTTTFHECYKCGSGWETKDEDFETEGAQARTWVFSGDSNDDFWSGFERAQKMQEAGQGSRSLSAAAARDPRSQRIKEILDDNKQQKEAGRKFTPREQREFIDERGIARNRDKLDLDGTHYESHRYLGDKANGANVRDEDLFLGL